jgi:hypothetical protein
MSKSEEGGLILKLYELRRDDTMRKAQHGGCEIQRSLGIEREAAI